MTYDGDGPKGLGHTITTQQVSFGAVKGVLHEPIFVLKKLCKV